MREASLKSECGVRKVKTKELDETFSLPVSWRTFCVGRNP